MSRKRGKCPICGKPTAESYRPFCSGRCADVDLGRWLGGTYRIPTDERPEMDDWPAADDDDA
ncbi:MAG: DNA gyrase inhibitor YacG [Alphaproteobacteria bacterium]|nr:DNA gyrase inhibitor YacG [Alphaproteobacteria bacterium]